ncbi:hypothetical protein O0I10_004621 [Lichtheimia ornata]|uniref:Uncharacterized protein n=1 Tax=Lichtheimia ornata TaxID=688661 RepID=A0AAD7V848_9FUNG|nr:uncharacterized protein O0I10_004621 [Lichtheimia ornata]KAJ8659642.1 hypothetical protein O0I10_004621 [Lichtheimia ornata]
MGVKQLHAIARRFQAYQQHANLGALLEEREINTIVVDFCPTFYYLLANHAVRILPGHLQGNGGYRLVQPDMTQFVNDCIERIQALVAPHRRVLLVLDGEAHPIKKETHIKRDLEAKKAFSRAKAEYSRLNGNIAGSEVFTANARKWLRFTPEIKDAICHVLALQGVPETIFPISDDLHVVPIMENNPIHFIVAPYEADGMVVALAELLGNGTAIISVDGDVLVYGGCLNTLRLMNVSWETGMVSRYCIKSQLLNSLGLQLEGDNDDMIMAQKLLLVLASVSGNDYAENIPTYSFGKMRERLLNGLQVNRTEYWDQSMYTIQQRLLSSFNNLPAHIPERMKKALVMYACPLADITNNRGWSPLQIGFEYNELFTILGNMEHLHVLRGPSETQGNRFIYAYNVQPIQRENTAPENTNDLRPPRQRVYAAAARGRGRGRGGRGRGGRGRGGRGRGAGGAAAQITVFSEDNATEHITISARSRAIRTWSMGLYSSVLSAAMTRSIPFSSNSIARFQENFDPIEGQALNHTRVICDILHNESKQMSFVRQVAFQMVNIALRHPKHRPLNEPENLNFYREFFSNDSQKIWIFIINCAMTRNYAYHRTGDPLYVDVPFHPFETDRAQQGFVGIDNPMQYAAHDAHNPAHLRNLIDTMHDKADFRDTMLQARAMWYQYYRNNNIDPPVLPNTQYRHKMVQSLAQQMDTNFKVNLITHFISRTEAFIAAYMTYVSDVPNGWPDLPETPMEGVNTLNHRLYILIREVINDEAPHGNIQNQIQNIMVETNTQLDNDVIASVATFITSQRNKRVQTGNAVPLTFNELSDALKDYAKRPRGWPTHVGLPQYVLANVFCIPWIQNDERTENIVNDDVCREVHEQVLGLPLGIQQDIRAFIRDIRANLQTAAFDFKIGIRTQRIPPNTPDDLRSRNIPLDIFDCLDLPRPDVRNRLAHIFVDVLAVNPQYIAWEQAMNQQWNQRIQQSIQDFQEKLNQVLLDWDNANQQIQLVVAQQDNRQPEMLSLHNDEFAAEWLLAGGNGLNRQQRKQNMLVLLENFDEMAKRYIHDIVVEETTRWYYVWNTCRNIVMEIRDVLYNDTGNEFLTTVEAMQDRIIESEGEIRNQWATEMNTFQTQLNQVNETTQEQYNAIITEIPQVLPLGPNGNIDNTVEGVQQEYQFWTGVINQRYDGFNVFCNQVLQQVHTTMVNQTTNLLHEMEELHGALDAYLADLAEQPEDGDDEEQEAVELDEQASDIEDEDDIMQREDDDPPTDQGINGFRTYALIPMLVTMLQGFPDRLSFALCPKAKSGNVCIPINRAIGRDILQHVNYFAQGIPNYANLQPHIQSLQQCVNYTRLIGYSETPFMIPLSTPIRAAVHDIITTTINDLIIPQQVMPYYTNLPHGVTIIDIHQQMIMLLHASHQVAQFDANGELVFPDNIQIQALYASQLYCDQLLLIRSLRVRTLIRSQKLPMGEPALDNLHHWVQPNALDNEEYVRMTRIYIGYYQKDRGLSVADFRTAYIHSHNRLCWETLVTVQYNANNQPQLPASVMGQYLDQWQSANIAIPQAQQSNVWNPYPFFFNPQYQSFVSGEGNVTVKHGRYYREFNRTIQGVNMVYPRYTIERLMTDGVRIHIVVRDWMKRLTRSRGDPIKYIPEVRKCRNRKLAQDEQLRDDLPVDVNNVDVELNQRVNLMQHHGFTGVVGVDLGETFAAGTFFLPHGPGVGVQHTIKRSELYGLTFTNRGIIESEKRANQINEIESTMSQGSTYSNMDKYLVYINNFQNDNNGLQLNNFYSRKTLIRRQWSNRLSMKAAKDKACTRVLSMGTASLNAPTQQQYQNQALIRRQQKADFMQLQTLEQALPWEDEMNFIEDVTQQRDQSQIQANARRQARLIRRENLSTEEQQQRLIIRREKRRRQRRRPQPTRMVIALDFIKKKW